jgi:hypothetical protein
MKSIRTALIESALGRISAIAPDKPINAIEVGCMFKEDEGLSTLAIAEIISRHPAKGRFISIEYDATHVDAARAILARYPAEFARTVEFRCGHSLALLPPALAELGGLDFASLDGGAHPEVCLQEFELACANLNANGLLLVDDLQELPPSQAYSLPRLFGKGTLILPMLILRNYLSNRDRFLDANAAPDGPDAQPASIALGVASSLPAVFDAPHEFALLGDHHKLLAYGTPESLHELKRIALTSKRPSLKRLLRCLNGR